ncbi:MAG: hypothetical protein AB8I08_11145 [Sandaracinaceae bacterium]
MRLASFAPCLTAALALWLGACTCGEAAPRALPEPEPIPAPDPDVPQTSSPTPPSVRAPGATGISHRDLPPLALTEPDQARTNEVIGLGGFTLGQSRDEAAARCTEVGGELTHVTRTVHRCVFAEREGQPRTHVDVALTPGDAPGPVGRISFVYTSGAGEPLIPAFAAVTGTLFERAGPPRSRSEREDCAVATANLLAACLEENLTPVEHMWRTVPTPVGNAEALAEAGVEALVASLQPSGDVWNLTLTHEATGYTEAFVAAYQDAEE